MELIPLINISVEYMMTKNNIADYANHLTKSWFLNKTLE